MTGGKHMSKWMIMPEGCRWYETDRGKTHEQAYSMEGHWYAPAKRVAVMDISTGAVKIFTRQLDPAGNLIQAQEVTT